MSRAALALVLIAVGVLAHLLRDRLEPGHRIPASAESTELPNGSTWLVDDPDGAYHLRRVVLALDGGGVPQTDRFMNFPDGAAVPWPTFFDAALAVAASATLPDGGQDPATGEVDEAAVEAFLVRMPPALGALTAALIGLLTYALTRGRAAGSRLLAAGLAGAVYAVTPIAMWYGGVARVDHHVGTALFLAAMLLACVQGFSARSMAGAVACGALAGVMAAASLLIWLAAALTVGIVGAVYFLGSLGADADSRRRAAAGGLAFFAFAALCTAPSAIASPWNELQPGSLINLSIGVPRALLTACLPYAALLLAGRLGRSRWLGAGVGVALTALLCAFLPGFLDGAREGFAWASRQNQFMDVVDESRPLLAKPAGLAGAWRDLGLVAMLAPLGALAAALTGWRRPGAWSVLGCFTLLLAMTLVQRRFGNSLAVPMSCVIGLAVTELWPGRAAERVSAMARFVPFLVTAVAATLIGASLWGARSTADQGDLADWRFERLAALQWMRTGTTSAGPFNAPDLQADYAVLSTWGYGHLIEYHARRPSVATGFGSFVGERNFTGAAEALLESDPERFLERARELGARYVVTDARRVSELASLSRIAGWTQAQRDELFVKTAQGKRYSPRSLQSALAQLSMHAGQVGTVGFAGCRLVHASQRFENPQARPMAAGQPGAGPVLSIWELPALTTEAR